VTKYWSKSRFLPLVIVLWPNTGVVKFKYYVSQKQNGFLNKIHWCSILLTFKFKFTARLLWTKIWYSVISVIVDLLPGNTKNRQSTRSWTARVRLFHPWADPLPTYTYTTSKPYSCVQGPLRECRSIRPGASGLANYCTPLVCVPAVLARGSALGRLSLRLELDCILDILVNIPPTVLFCCYAATQLDFQLCAESYVSTH